MDRVNSETRSRIMARVQSKHTGPELTVRKALHSKGVRFRLHRRDLPGSPDVVLPGRHLAIFVHGCFWHGHDGCSKGGLPKSRLEYWGPKIVATKVRDSKNIRALERIGWTISVIWQCQTKDPSVLSAVLDSLLIADPQIA